MQKALVKLKILDKSLLSITIRPSQQSLKDVKFSWIDCFKHQSCCHTFWATSYVSCSLGFKIRFWVVLLTEFLSKTVASIFQTAAFWSSFGMVMKSFPVSNLVFNSSHFFSSLMKLSFMSHWACFTSVSTLRFTCLSSTADSQIGSRSTSPLKDQSFRLKASFGKFKWGWSHWFSQDPRGKVWQNEQRENLNSDVTWMVRSKTTDGYSYTQPSTVRRRIATVIVPRLSKPSRWRHVFSNESEESNPASRSPVPPPLRPWIFLSQLHKHTSAELTWVLPIPWWHGCYHVGKLAIKAEPSLPTSSPRCCQVV